MCLHTGPDLDSLCSNYAMYQYLKNLGKSCDVFSYDALPNNFGLFDTKFIKVGVETSDIDFKGYDLFIGLDLGDLNMLSRLKDFQFPKNLALKKINIDHHGNKKWGDINLIEEKRASTCLILYSLFAELNFKMDKNLKTALLLGYLFDSGIFHYKHNSEDLRIVADLIEERIDIDELIWSLNFNTDYDTFQYKVKVLSNVNYDTKRKIAWSKLSVMDKKELGGELTRNKKTIGWVDTFKDIKGIKFAVMFNESEKGYVSVSFRSNQRDYDVSKLAKALGGGGHKSAAATVLRETNLEQAIKRTFEVIDSIS